jgi:hypothetical protein
MNTVVMHLRTIAWLPLLSRRIKLRPPYYNASFDRMIPELGKK